MPNHVPEDARPDSLGDFENLGGSVEADRSSTASKLDDLVARLERDIVGQRPLLDRLIVGLLAGGHLLIEGVPGLAKTRSVHALALALDLSFRRIQFTPDLLPADLTGTQIYRPGAGTFEVRTGPIVAQVVLADEINRAPAKVQSALLEAMQEGQVTVGDRTLNLPEPFWVLATQNPVDHEGTYPLPEAQLDRFLMKLNVDYPDRAAELALFDLAHPQLSRNEHAEPATLAPILDAIDVLAMRAEAASIHVAASIKEYVVDLVRATRDPTSAGIASLAPLIERGAGPRASLGLIAASRANALRLGRGFVTPHDVKTLARDVLRHRIVPSYEADAEGQTAESIISQILDHVPVP